MNLGDKIVKTPYIGEHENEPHEGRVVYVHPEGRFYTLEFTFERGGAVGSFRESFLADPPPMEESVSRAFPGGKPRFNKRWGKAYKPIE